MTEFRFHPGPVHVPTGRVTFAVTNVGTVAHDFTVLTPDGHTRIGSSGAVPPGATVRVQMILVTGSYPVVCAQPGHQEAGMGTRIEAG